MIHLCTLQTYDELLADTFELVDTSEPSKKFTKQGKAPFLAHNHHMQEWVPYVHAWILCCSDSFCLPATRLLQASFCPLSWDPQYIMTHIVTWSCRLEAARAGPCHSCHP